MKKRLFLLPLSVAIVILVAGCGSKETQPPQAPTQGEAAGSAFSSAIENVTVADDHYVIQYQKSGFGECLESQDCVHVHFFFNTVKPEAAVVPGEGPWELSHGSSPYDGYQVAERPAAATEMCILVANADHTGHPATTHCVDLPK